MNSLIRIYFRVLDKVFMKSVSGLYPGTKISRYTSIKNLNPQQK
jgi:hypothetical protein